MKNGKTAAAEKTLERVDLQDNGFGIKLPTPDKTRTDGTRLINLDGSFNVERRGLPRGQALSVYQSLIAMSWPRFTAIVVGAYVSINLVFALLYLTLGIDHIAGHTGAAALDCFWDAYFFSAQTLTTVGYGRMSPTGFSASAVASLESLLGLMGFALGTGLLYSRFARPQARLLFSRQALIAPYRGGAGLMFRMANGRKNQLIEAEVQVSLSVANAKDGTRMYHELPLERRMIHFFPLSWTVVHPIDAASPLFGFGPEEFRRCDGEIFVQLKAFDDTFSQTIYSRYSYRLEDVVYGAKFAYIYGRSEKGAVTIDLHRIGEHAPAEIPLIAAAPETP